MKIRIINYDASEFKILEEELLKLANQGYTCKSVGPITFFTKTNKKANYIVDLFCPTATSKYKRNLEKDRWIANYIDRGYTHIGTVKGMYIFVSEKEHLAPETPTNQLYDHFRGLHTFSKVFFCLIAIFLCYLFIPNTFDSSNINDFTTNSSIILKYIPLPISILFLFRTVMNGYHTLQIKKNITNDIYQLNSPKKKQMLYKVYIYGMGLSLAILFFGLGLEMTLPDTSSSTNESVVTLAMLQDTVSKDNIVTFNEYSSILIPTSYRYSEQGGEYNNEESIHEDLISIRYYQLKDANTTEAFASNIINYPQKFSSTSIEPLSAYPGAYLGYSIANNIPDTMFIIQDKTIVIIATSFDLSLENHQQAILDVYYTK